MIRERDIEQRLIRAVRERGGLCWKFVSPGMAGVPDRLCLFPNGVVKFAEVKKPGAKPRPLQEKRIAQLRKMGFRVAVIDSPDDIEGFVDGAKQTPARRETKSGGGGDA